ncbi:MAG TPA: hypothetical protein DEP76_12675 [Alteromonas sp.]|nr:hypothetical protein [Alteromonas sp.]|tara:strand:- start:157 stop:783 length:627 start_codon:yes stop_codon:yes gene_type:complete
MVDSFETKVCPYCAESIKAAAVVCRFCSRELEGDKPKSNEPKSHEVVTEKVKCKTCNKRILPSTASKHHGNCARCDQYLKKIETFKFYFALSTIVALAILLYLLFFTSDEPQQTRSINSLPKVKNSTSEEIKSNTEVGNYSGTAGYYLLEDDARPIATAALIKDKPDSLINSLKHGCRVITARYNNSSSLTARSKELYRKTKAVCDTY